MVALEFQVVAEGEHVEETQATVQDGVLESLAEDALMGVWIVEASFVHTYILEKLRNDTARKSQ
jgi:hypothetical protein